MKNYAKPPITATSAASSTWTKPVPEYSDTCASGSRNGCRRVGFGEESRQRVNLASDAVVKSIWASAKFQGVPFAFCAQFLPSLEPKEPMVPKEESRELAPSLLMLTKRILSSLVLWISWIFAACSAHVVLSLHVSAEQGNIRQPRGTDV
jgi:hypothetical protein